MLVGQNLMNCSLCKYREQVLGFEAEVGLAQESHHHHVEGIGGGLEDCPCGGDCDASCRDKAFCEKHGLPWTPVHAHEHDHPHPASARRRGARPPSPRAIRLRAHPLGPVTLPKVQGKLAQRGADDAADAVRGASGQRRARSMTYLRDPDAIYAQSFAIIRAEADLAHLPACLARSRRSA